MINFKGKVALITGASRGIGSACSMTLAQYGCNIALNYKSNEEAANTVSEKIRLLGSIAKLYRADVADTDEIQSMVDSIINDFGRIDILINSAGISEIISIHDIKQDNWDDMMNINLRGTFFCCQRVLKYMEKQRSGRIVNLASTAGQMGGFIVGVNYSASKAGVIGMTKSIAKYAICFGITVNCVAPGLIETDMVSTYPPEQVASLVSSIPIGRMGTPQEVANGIAFLASDAASYITGTTLYINGGTYLG
jgi:3-oxoacyl-[acyl-carrier protein] reductase